MRLPDDRGPCGFDAQHVVDFEYVVGLDLAVVDAGDLKDLGEVRALGVDDVALCFFSQDGAGDAPGGGFSGLVAAGAYLTDVRLGRFG